MSSSNLQVLENSQLWHDFQRIAKSEDKPAVDVLTELIADYIEQKTDTELFDEIYSHGRKSAYDEDDLVDLVKDYRARH